MNDTTSDPQGRLQPLQGRLQALREALEEHGLAAAILSRPEHVFYFTGVMPGRSPVFLLVTPGGITAASPAEIPGCETVAYVDYDINAGWFVTESAAAALERLLEPARLRERKVGVELGQLPAAFMPAIHGRSGEVSEIGDLLWRLRRIKDEAEIAQIEANVARNDHIFGLLREAVRPGVKDFALWAVVHAALCEDAGGPVTLEADLGAGPATANPPGALPEGHVLTETDHVLADIYTATHGYYADTTRVFAVGEPTVKQMETHWVLEDALEAGTEHLRPGVAACEVDAAVRRVIAEAGFADNFPHHSGHAFGLFQQERPYIIPAESMPLEAGMVITLEPGIYIPGWGGMRLEGNWAITADGARRLDRYPDRI
jgi:Xaa-Pro aminopeptidase